MPGYGQNTDVDAAAEPLVGSATLVLTGVRIKALAANGANYIYVGNNSSVSATTGYQLAAGEECSFDVGFFADPGAAGDLQDIYVIGSAANLAVCYWYV